ncbi:twin-arginine translocation signal domain-containing protein [Micromonospora rifamycinica]|uniref:twin-arginine translocation signal domain-containing protein n=1 Tax=Micromonospora rifamycinica TaxID=291594 RepID=UPI003420B8C5
MQDRDSEDATGGQLSRRQLVKYAGVGATLAAAGPFVGVEAAHADPDRQEAAQAGAGRPDDRIWRAGDHHIHSEYSGDFDTTTNPPTFRKGADAVYPIVTNAIMAKNFGLTWAMCTDHGGPTHSKVNLELAYPDLLRSRRLVPEVLQFWGMEFDAPAMDHHTLMIPRHADEAKQLFELESRFAKRDPFPADPGRDTEAKMVEFLKVARTMPHKPLVIAHHTSRSATGLGVYGQDLPHEFRNGNDAAPDVYVGFEGAPGAPGGAAQRQRPRRLRQPPHLRRLRPGDRPGRRAVGRAARGGTALVDHRDLRLARALDPGRHRLLAGRVQQDLRAGPPGVPRHHGRAAARADLRHHR